MADASNPDHDHPELERDPDGGITVLEPSDVRYARRDLSGIDVETVIDLLETDQFENAARNRVVAWLPDHLAEEKQLTFADQNDRIAVGTIIHATDAAWCLHQRRHDDEEGAWLPKSATEVFRRGRTDCIRQQQTGLEQYGDGGDR